MVLVPDSSFDPLGHHSTLSSESVIRFYSTLLALFSEQIRCRSLLCPLLYERCIDWFDELLQFYYLYRKWSNFPDCFLERHFSFFLCCFEGRSSSLNLLGGEALMKDGIKVSDDRSSDCMRVDDRNGFDSFVGVHGIL